MPQPGCQRPEAAARSARRSAGPSVHVAIIMMINGMIIAGTPSRTRSRGDYPDDHHQLRRSPSPSHYYREGPPGITQAHFKSSSGQPRAGGTGRYQWSAAPATARFRPAGPPARGASH